MAEDLGLIGEIGNWVIDTAICEASNWQQPMQLAINVSPQQLSNMDVFQNVAAALKVYGFPADRLDLEITEYAILQDDGATIQELERLKDLGVRIVLDDFGTGYSSLSYLHRFPFDKLKIDRSFVAGFEHDDRRKSIIRSITTLAINLGMEVTAEGIETDEQLQVIRSMDCTYAQGYLLGRPKPASDRMGGKYLKVNNDATPMVA